MVYSHAFPRNEGPSACGFDFVICDVIGRVEVKYSIRYVGAVILMSNFAGGKWRGGLSYGKLCVLYSL